MPLYTARSARDLSPVDSLQTRGPIVRLASCLLGALLIAAPSTVFAQTTTTSPARSSPPAAVAGPGKAPATSAGTAAASSGSLAQYSSESDASSKCSGDTVVWANSTSKALHMSGDRYFGKSKHGFYACQKDALAAGYHVAGKHHKHVAKSA